MERNICFYSLNYNIFARQKNALKDCNSLAVSLNKVSLFLTLKSKE